MRILVIPGGDISSFNSLVDTDTLGRCQEGVRLWESREYDLMLLCGGITEAPSIQTLPAAKIMADWINAQATHPKPHELLLEEASRDTYENAHFLVQLLRERHYLDHITRFDLVTERHHAIRLSISLSRAWGIKNIHVYPTPSHLGLKNRLEEEIFILIHWLDPRGDNWLARRNRARRTF